MTRIKICGITTPGDALACAAAGADLLGLNFYRPGPRYVSPSRAAEIVRAIRGNPATAEAILVGIFVDEDPEWIVSAMDEIGLDAAQLSGDEPPEHLAQLGGRGYKAIRPADPGELQATLASILPYPPDRADLPGGLLDAHHETLYGGTGKTVGLELARTAVRTIPRMMLAGGLRPDNVAHRIREIAPWGVDTASGVETDTPGIKDMERVRAFIAAVRTVDGGAHDEAK